MHFCSIRRTQSLLLGWRSYTTVASEELGKVVHSLSGHNNSKYGTSILGMAPRALHVRIESVIVVYRDAAIIDGKINSEWLNDFFSDTCLMGQN